MEYLDLKELTFKEKKKVIIQNTLSYVLILWVGVGLNFSISL